MNDRLEQEHQAFEAALAAVEDEAGLYRLQVAYLGKKGSITGLSKQMGGLSSLMDKLPTELMNKAKAGPADTFTANYESLLGWDLLSRFDLRIHGPTRSVTLERP